MRRTYPQRLLALLIATAAWASFGAGSAQDVVRTSTDALLEVIREGKTYAESDEERFFQSVEGVLAPVIDFDGIARSVMAVHYRKASEAQRTRFVDVFKWGLVRAYAKALLEFGDEKIEVLEPDKPPRCRDDGTRCRQTIGMEVTTAGGTVYPIAYTMVDTGNDGWRMRNLIINGVNLGLTYRNQFAGAMKDKANGGDLDRVIDGWADVITTVDPMSDAEPSEPVKTAS